MSDQEHSDQLHEYSPGLRSGEITAAIECSPSRSTRENRLRSHSHSRSRSRSRSRSFTHPYSHSRSHSRERRYRYRSRSRSPRHREHSPMSPRRSYYDDDDRYRSSNSSRARSPMSGRRDTGDRDHPEINRCLGVFGLSLYTQERELREVFEKYGPIEDIQVVYDAQSRQSRGFAFIYFENTDDAKEVRERCDGLEIDGRKIRVDYSITKRAHSPTPGVYMGKRTFSRYGGRDNRRYGGGGGDRGYRDRGYSPNYYRRRYSRSRSYSPHRRSYY